MRVEIWTDIICPWCGLGRHQLKKALAQFGHAGDIELVQHSYQLDERTPEGVVEPVREMLSKKKGIPAAQVDAMTGRVAQLAKAAGLEPYVVADNQVGNTSLAHELSAFAASEGRGAEVWDALYRRYFGEAGSIFDVDSLVALAVAEGLDGDKAREALVSRRYRDKVRADGQAARELGVNGVPFILLDGRYGISGAQPVEAMLAGLEQAYRASRGAR